MAAPSVESKLNQLEKEIDHLRSLFDQHFAGVMKRAPLKEHDGLKALIRSFTPADLKTTAYKFRFQSLKTRHSQLANLWEKTLQQIEDGTYRRDLFLLKAKERLESTQAPGAKAAPSPKQATSKFDSLYEKFKEAAQKADQKVPAKEAFISSLQKQIDLQKQKNPKAKFEVKLQKDASGKTQVKLKVLS
jgi:hypothetical protein